MRDCMSWRTAYSWQKVLHFNANELVTKDHLSWGTIYFWPKKSQIHLDYPWEEFFLFEGGGGKSVKFQLKGPLRTNILGCITQFLLGILWCVIPKSLKYMNCLYPGFCFECPSQWPNGYSARQSDICCTGFKISHGLMPTKCPSLSSKENVWHYVQLKWCVRVVVGRALSMNKDIMSVLLFLASGFKEEILHQRQRLQGN